MVLDLIPITLITKLIFDNDNLILQDFPFKTFIVPIQTILHIHGDSLVHRLFNVGGLLFFVVILIG